MKGSRAAGSGPPIGRAAVNARFADEGIGHPSTAASKFSA